MRWFPFLILAYLFVAVQFSLGSLLHGWGQWTPNLVLILAIFVGLHAPAETALFAGFLLGLMHDVVGGQGIGTLALGYTLVAFLAVQLRGMMYSDHFVTHVMITLMLGTALVIYLLLRQSVRNLYFEPESLVSLRPRMMGVLITALLAVPTIAMLRKVRRSFAFENRD